jgi:hypothetical protein
MSTIGVAPYHDLTDVLESSLERQLIIEYLLSKGYQKSDLQYLPEEQQKALIKGATIYAAVWLANIDLMEV